MSRVSAEQFDIEEKAALDKKQAVLDELLEYCEAKKIDVPEPTLRKIKQPALAHNVLSLLKAFKYVIHCLPDTEAGRCLGNQILAAENEKAIETLLAEKLPVSLVSSKNTPTWTSRKRRPAPREKPFDPETAAIALRCLMQLADWFSLSKFPKDVPRLIGALLINKTLFSQIIEDEEERKRISAWVCKFLLVGEESYMRAFQEGGQNYLEVYSDSVDFDFEERYREEARLVEGGFSEVFVFQRCDDVEKKIAIKMQTAVDGLALKDVVLEMRCFRKAHPDSAVPYRARSFQDDSGQVTYCHTMKLLLGVTLKQFYEEHKADARLLWAALLAIAKAFQDLNKAGVANLDVNSKNVLVQYDERSKEVRSASIVDFGYAAFFGEPCPAILGSAHFDPTCSLAPEGYLGLFPGGVRASARVNVFGWGNCVSACELMSADSLFGRAYRIPPEERPTIEEVIDQLESQQRAHSPH